MEKIFENFLSIHVLFFCLFVSGLVLILRRTVEYFVKSLNKRKLWSELLLPISPLLIGGALSAIVKTYPYPDPFNATTSSRLFFGFVIGGFSGQFYRIIKAFLLKKEKEISSK